jgi:hypothetical protein
MIQLHDIKRAIETARAEGRHAAVSPAWLEQVLNELTAARAAAGSAQAAR